MAKIAHCAPPEVSGLAWRTFVPGRARSSNVASPFGFPFRVTKTMTDLITAPLFGFFRQSEEISPFSFNWSRYSSEERTATCTGAPPRIWFFSVPEPAKEAETSTSFPNFSL